MSNSTAAATSSMSFSSDSPTSTPTPTPSVVPSSVAPSSSIIPSAIVSTSLTEPSSSVPASSQPASSAPVSIPSSHAPSSSAVVSSVPPSSAQIATSVITASSAPPSTQVVTSLITPSATVSGETPAPSVVIITSVITPSQNPVASSGTATTGKSSTTSVPGSLQSNTNKGENGGGGLSPAGKTAIAVVIPVVVVAVLVVAGIFLWRKRKQRKNAEEERRKEVEEYGYNPNHDPTLPAVGGVAGSEMAEDASGYRGWGNTTNSNRKASTTLTSGMTGTQFSDNGSNPGGYHSPGSPTQGGSDGHSSDPLMNGRRETMDSETIGALGAAPAANQNRDINRGPSNASSSYSAANRSDNSGEYSMPQHNPQDYYNNDPYYQPGSYGNGYGGDQQPVIRDVSARRNTRIENPSVFPQQGNSGIAQNF